MIYDDQEFRAALVRAVSDELDFWDNGFYYAGAALARAVVDGRIEVDDLDGTDWRRDPVDESREMAHAAGLLLEPEYDPSPDERWRTVTAEHVSAVIGVFYGLVEGNVDVYSGAFSFHEETLTGHGITLDDVRGYVQTLDLVGAAQLLHDGFARLQPPMQDE